MFSTLPPNQRLKKLMECVAVRDHAAFEQLYQLTSTHLYGVAMRCVRRRELADEVLQEAFISVWQHAGGYAASLSTPMTWLISIVRNKSLDHLRKVKLEAETVAGSEDGIHQESAEALGQLDPLEQLAAAMERQHLARCLLELNPEQRQSLALAYYHGLSHSEIASHLQVPLGTAKSWLRRALERLRISYEVSQGSRAKTRVATGATSSSMST